MAVQPDVGAPSRETGAAWPEGEPRTFNRELSLLDFHARVLALGEDEGLPLLERAKFLAIFANSLDEVFQVRVAGLKEQLAAGISTPSPDGLSPRKQLEAIRDKVLSLVERHTRAFTEELLPGLEKAGLRFATWDELDDEDRAYLETEFSERIFPVLTPLSVDPSHPFPYISNLSLNLAVFVRDPHTRLRRFARVKVPPLLPRFIVLPDGERFVAIEAVIAHHLQALFPGMEVVAHYPFRVTRDADIEIEEDEAEDLLSAVESVLRRRRRAEDVVRLEVEASMPDEVQELLTRELKLEPEDVYAIDGTLDLSGLWALVDLDRPDLKEEPWSPVTEPRLAGAAGEPPDIFAVLREGDVLVHHPYDSFTSSVVAFIEQAAADPAVLAVKQTLYRTSGSPVSPIVSALIKAAESGKQVVALVELTARFDEQANIGWARALEQAGVHVVFGVVGLKTHVKSTLVVRREADGIRRYCHVGTGNYNPNTATIYEDVGLLSTDPDLGADLTEHFNYLTGYSRQRDYRKLIVAPVALRTRLHELIEEQARPGGRITLKVNSLIDTDMVESLYAAAAAGAETALIVRGICVLRPGAPGLSERIRVRSIVGRYLEHSRIFRFGEGPSARFFIGSADLSPRNLDRRVEAVVPVTAPALKERLGQILDVNLADDSLAWELSADGTWRKLPAMQGVNAQRRLQELAVERARGREAADA